MWPDLQTALEVVDLYAEKCLEKPNAEMTKSQFDYCCEQWNTIDILKEHLIKHWGEAQSSDIVYYFVKDRDRLQRLLKDPKLKLVYEISKEIFFYFI